MAKQFKPETLCVQAGWTPKKGEPRVLPIYQSTTSNTTPANKWHACSTLRTAVISTPACKTPRTMPLPPR